MMKKIMTALAAALCLFAACTTNKASEETRVCTCSATTDLLSFHLSAEMPSDRDAVSAAVRTSLLAVLENEMKNLGVGEEPSAIPTWSGDPADLEGAVNHYGTAAVENLKKMAAADSAARTDYVAEEFEFPAWEFDCEIKKVDSGDRWWVYLAQNYVYLGGAHGGVTGSGYLTYSKLNGTLIKNIIDNTKVAEIQPLLRKGLVHYFAACGDEVTEDGLDDYLFIEDGVIPLPIQEPWPTKDGLGFVYQQYEIAPYAMGMPSFTIPYDEVKQFLSPEAIELLGL